MGYDTGDFTDRIHGPLHVEASSGLVQVWFPDELKLALSLEPEQARMLIVALENALWYYE